MKDQGSEKLSKCMSVIPAQSCQQHLLRRLQASTDLQHVKHKGYNLHGKLYLQDSYKAFLHRCELCRLSTKGYLKSSGLIYHMWEGTDKAVLLHQMHITTSSESAYSTLQMSKTLFLRMNPMSMIASPC